MSGFGEMIYRPFSIRGPLRPVVTAVTLLGKLRQLHSTLGFQSIGAASICCSRGAFLAVSSLLALDRSFDQPSFIPPQVSQH